MDSNKCPLIFWGRKGGLLCSDHIEDADDVSYKNIAFLYRQQCIRLNTIKINKFLLDQYLLSSFELLMKH